MKKISIFLIALLFSVQCALGQGEQANIIYIVDSIPVTDTPLEGIELAPDDVADINVIKNKDTLRLLGYERFDGAIYVFTKAYRTRSEELRRIPSTRQMERKGGVWHFRGTPYSGAFIDYYFNGKKEGEGSFVEGRVHGNRFIYHPNGSLSVERTYANGIEHGESKEFYEDGSLSQKGSFNQGKEEGVWEMYYPNGQVKQRSTFSGGVMNGETTVYYSTGKVKAVEMVKNGKATPDPRNEKVNKVLDRGHESNRAGDFKSAIKSYSKAIELDSTNAEAYFARGTAKLNNFLFEEAVVDFDKALVYEPYYAEVLANRAYARIRKHQFTGSRKLSSSGGVTVLAAKDNPGIPEADLTLICEDLKKAIFLGDHSKMTLEGAAEFCKQK